MKKTQRKDTMRNIWKEKISYLSIMIIALLAVTIYLGINFGAEALRVNANRFYQKRHYRDLELSSTLLLGEEDLTALREADGVADAEGVLVTQGKAARQDGSQNLEIVSLTERINTAEVLEGRLPATPEECAVEEELLQVLGLSIGDTVTVSDAAGGTPAYLLRDTFVITGSAHHPDHYALENQAPGNRYLLVLPGAFDREALDDSYMKAVLRIEKPEGISYFSKKYKKQAAAVQDSLDALCKEREALRTKKVHDRYDEAIADAETELADGRKELEDGRKELDDSAQKVADGEKELQEGREKLDDGAQQVKDGEQELEDAYAQLDDGRKQLQDAQEQLTAARQELEDGKKELDEAHSQLESARKELDDAAKTLAEGKTELAKTYNEAEYQKALARYQLQLAVNENAGEHAAGIRWAGPSYVGTEDIDDPSLSCTDFVITASVTVDLTRPMDEHIEKVVDEMDLSPVEKKLVIASIRSSGYYAETKEQYNAAAEGGKAWNKGHREYLDGKKKYDDGLKTYKESLAQYEDGVKEYNKGLEEYRSGLATYSEKLKEYEDGKADYEKGGEDLADAKKELADGEAEYRDAEKELADGKEELAEGENKYAEGLEELAQGEKDLAKAKEDRDALGDCHFVLLPARGNASFTHAEDSADNVSKIGMTFALLFVLLAALVIYATVGRIIGEQRKLIGTGKALGLFSSEVFRKYLAFGLSASVAGIFLGAAVGYLIVQRLVLISHEQFYVTGVIPRIFRYGMGGAILVIGAILATAAVYWACAQLLRETAKNLMQEQAPKGRKKTETKERKGSLYSRLVLRNMLTDWQRVLITMVSVAGCCVLLVIGFTLNDSIYNAVDRQFEEILLFTDRVSFDRGISETAGDEIREKLEAAGTKVTGMQSVYRTFSSPEGLTAAELICVDAEEIPDYFRLRETDNKTGITMADRGIYITRRIAEAYGLAAGDTFTIYDGKMNPREAEVAGVFEYYFGKIMILSKEAYRDLFGEDSEDNAFWIRKTVSGEELEALVAPVKGFEEITSKESTRQRYLTQISVLGMITAMMIAAAGMLAFFVLLNLINMYLNKKNRELTIMRINGFTTKEVIRYVAGESVVTTVLGILLGLAAGSVLAYQIVCFVEQSQIGLMKNIDLKGWLLSALLTGAFAFVINAIALRKVRRLSLRDI